MTAYPGDNLKVEIFTIPDDNFIMGLSLLGFETLGGSGLTPAWRTIQCDANRVTLRRGGDVGGVSTDVDAGYTAITIVNSNNPIQDPGILPSVPIKVSSLIPHASTGIEAWESSTGGKSMWASSFRTSPTEVGTITPGTDSFNLYLDTAIPYQYTAVTNWQFPRPSAPAGVPVRVTAQVRAKVDGLWFGTFAAEANKVPLVKDEWVTVDLIKRNTSTGSTMFANTNVWPFNPSDYTSSTPPAGPYLFDLDIRKVRVEFFDPTWKTIFTGDVEDVAVRYDKKGNAFTTLSAADNVRDMKNIIRKGDRVATDFWVGERTFYECAVSLAAGTGIGRRFTNTFPAQDMITTNVIDYSTPTLTGWSRWGTNPTGVTPGALVLSAGRIRIQDNAQANTTTAELVELNRGVQYTLTGLEVGKTYFARLNLENHDTPVNNDNYDETAPYALGVVIGGTTSWGPSVSANKPYKNSGGLFATRNTFPYVSFKATATSHVMRLARAFTGRVKGSTEATTFRVESVGIVSFTVQRTSSGGRWIPMQDVNYESTIFNHVSMLALSANVDWWIDANNVLTYQPFENYTGQVLELSDKHTNDPSHMCYTDIIFNYDTKNIVNTLDITNHGAQVNPDIVNTFLVRDTETQYVDSSSVTTYKNRADRIDLRIAPWAEGDRAAQLLSRSVNPELRASSITVNAMEHPEITALELFARINVKFKDFQSNYRVVGIDHDIDKDTWNTTLTLRREP